MGRGFTKNSANIVKGVYVEIEPYEELDEFGKVRWVTTAPASPADLLAAVRRGVESGTIKGEEALIEFNPDLRCYTVDGAALSDGIYVLIGPVSDGGEDRP